MSTLKPAIFSALPNNKPEASSVPNPPRPTLILVHGGWSGPETFSLIVPGLEKAGYSVVAISLPSSGTVPAISDFSADVNIIRSVVTSTLATGKDVVLVMHSYGAVVGCEALKSIKQDETDILMESAGVMKVGKVVKLAFIAGCLFPVGKSVYEKDRGSESRLGFICEVC